MDAGNKQHQVAFLFWSLTHLQRTAQLLKYSPTHLAKSEVGCLLPHQAWNIIITLVTPGVKGTLGVLPTSATTVSSLRSHWAAVHTSWLLLPLPKMSVGHGWVDEVDWGGGSWARGISEKQQVGAQSMGTTSPARRGAVRCCLQSQILLQKHSCSIAQAMVQDTGSLWRPWG